MHYWGGTAITIIVRHVKFALELVILIPTLFFKSFLSALKIVRARFVTFGVLSRNGLVGGSSVTRALH